MLFINRYAYAPTVSLSSASTGDKIALAKGNNSSNSIGEALRLLY